MRLSNRKFKQIRKALQDNNWNADNAYQQLMSEEKLFGHAFFGWAGTAYQRRKMKNIWRGVLFILLEEGNLRDWQRKLLKQTLER